MKKKRGSHIGWWVFFLVVLGIIIGFLLISERRHGPKDTLMIQNPASTEIETPEKIIPTNEQWIEKSEHQDEEATDPSTEQTGLDSVADEERCANLQENVETFFDYLNEKEYIQQMRLNVDTFTRFKRILAKLSAH